MSPLYIRNKSFCLIKHAFMNFQFFLLLAAPLFLLLAVRSYFKERDQQNDKTRKQSFNDMIRSGEATAEDLLFAELFAKPKPNLRWLWAGLAIAALAVGMLILPYCS
jgi:hypothetical protein